MSQVQSQTLDVAPQDNPANHPAPLFSRSGEQQWCGRFNAMASPCEVHIESTQISSATAQALVLDAVVETWRIESKFSRYRPNNIVDQINKANGLAVQVDEETANLIDYAEQCYQLSGGLFDVTSGPLRHAWRFQGEAFSPAQNQIDAILRTVGWPRCTWRSPWITLPPGAEMDLGGIGKEYAVDRVCQKLMTHADAKDLHIMVNFGGDIVCSGPRLNNKPWLIGLQNTLVGATSTVTPVQTIALHNGGIATSGDTHRFALYKGRKLSHILNPKTGWPIANAPSTVTVMAPTCTLAGMLATFAMLQGKQAEAFLREQNYPHWVHRQPSSPYKSTRNRPTSSPSKLL